jgi:hypothetical protein
MLSEMLTEVEFPMLPSFENENRDDYEDVLAGDTIVKLG